MTIHGYFPKYPDIPIYTHMVAFGGAPGHQHPRLNYRSDDPATIARQISEIKGWGCNGIILDWYGPFGSQYQVINNAAGRLLEACVENGLKFVLSVDAGALQASSDPNVDLISILGFANAFFLTNPAYMKSGDKFLVFEFGMETLAKPIDWKGIIKIFPEMGFIHRNIGGFSTLGAGSYAWIDSGLPYLADYYKRALQPSQSALCFGSIFARYDDRKVDSSGNPIIPGVNVWGKKRPDGSPNITIIDANNGQTFLDTVKATNDFLDAGGKLAGIVLNTYSDWEENSAVEGGILVKNPSPVLDVTPKTLFKI